MDLRFFEVQIQRTDVCCYTTVFEGKFNWKTMWPHAVSCRLSKFTSPQINHQCKVMHMEWKVPKVCNMITLCSMFFFVFGDWVIRPCICSTKYTKVHMHTCTFTHVNKHLWSKCICRHMQLQTCMQAKHINEHWWQMAVRFSWHKPSWYPWCQVSFSHQKIISDKDPTFSLVMTNGVRMSTSPQPSFMTVRKQTATLAILKGHWFQSYEPLWIVQVAPGVRS